jgi:hypothetical protein
MEAVEEVLMREDELKERCCSLQTALEEAERKIAERGAMTEMLRLKVAQLQSALEEKRKDTRDHLEAINEGSPRTATQSNPPRTPSKSSAARVMAQYTASPSCGSSVAFQPSPSKMHKTSSWTHQASAPVSPSPVGRSSGMPLRSPGVRPDLFHSVLRPFGPGTTKVIALYKLGDSTHRQLWNMLENVLPNNWANEVHSWYDDHEIADALLEAIFSDTA